MNKNEILEKYNLETYINTELSQNYKDLDSIQRYIEKNGEENLDLFSEMFWDDKSDSISNLKKELNITNNIGYSDILKAYPKEKYINFLNDYYVNEICVDELAQKYGVDIRKVENLLIDFVINIDDRYCPKCLENKYKVDFEDTKIKLTCKQCSKSMSYEETYSQEERDETKEKIIEAGRNYNKKIDMIKDKLERVKCPRCQNQLMLYRNENMLTYTIFCEKCSYSSSSIDEVEIDYEKWKHRAAMMIAIKSKEQELIEEKLKVKNQGDISFVNEEILSREFAYSKMEKYFNVCKINSEIGSILELKKILKSCSRLERNLLIYIIKISEELGESFQLKEVALKRIIFKNPLVIELVEKTGIIVVRKVLKELMKKFLILVDEENNYIIISEHIISKLDVIENCNDTQNIEPHLRYMTMSRQNFSCYTCGEDGKKLKIAYLTTNKKTMNLDEVVALCTDCFELHTKNDVVIDGIVSFDIFQESLSKSIQFLLKFMPDLKDVSKVYDLIEELEDEYGYQNTIKALAISLNAVTCKRLEKTIDVLIRYTKGVIKNADLDGEGITMYRNIYCKYNLDEWGINEKCIV